MREAEKLILDQLVDTDGSKNDAPRRKRPRQQADKENDGIRTKRRKKKAPEGSSSELVGIIKTCMFQHLIQIYVEHLLYTPCILAKETKGEKARFWL